MEHSKGRLIMLIRSSLVKYHQCFLLCSIFKCKLNPCNGKGMEKQSSISRTLVKLLFMAISALLLVYLYNLTRTGYRLRSTTILDIFAKNSLDFSKLYSDDDAENFNSDDLEYELDDEDESSDIYKGRNLLIEDTIKRLTLSHVEVRQAMEKTKLARERVIMDYINKSKSLSFKPPLPLLENITNPCWFDSSMNPTKQRCLPYFYLAGFPKCGTTDLWVRLLQHPQIAKVWRKEPHWWTRFRFNTSRHGARNMTYYTRYFNNVSIAEKNSIAGDGSVSTAWDDLRISLGPRLNQDFANNSQSLSNQTLQAYLQHELLPIHLIHSYTPRAKYIFILRNPTERLYSDYLYFSRWDVNLSKENFHKHCLMAVRDAFFCIAKYGIRYCAYDVHFRHLRQMHKMRLQNGMYPIFINDLFKIIPRQNIMIINFEAYTSHRRQTLTELCTFLGVDTFSKLIDHMDFNYIFNKGPQKQRMGDMWESTRELIDQFYRPYNIELARILGDNNFLWQ